MQNGTPSLSGPLLNHFLMLHLSLITKYVSKVSGLPLFVAFTLKSEPAGFRSRCLCLPPVGPLYGAGQPPLRDVSAHPSEGCWRRSARDHLSPIKHADSRAETWNKSGLFSALCRFALSLNNKWERLTKMSHLTHISKDWQHPWSHTFADLRYITQLSQVARCYPG